MATGLTGIFADMAALAAQTHKRRALDDEWEDARGRFAEAWLDMTAGDGFEATCDATADRLQRAEAALDRYWGPNIDWRI